MRRFTVHRMERVVVACLLLLTSHIAMAAGRFDVVESTIDGLHAAIDYVAGLSWDAIRAHEAALLAKALDRLRAIPGLRFQGRPARQAPVMSLTVEGIHPHDVGTVLDAEGVAVRAGHHCVQPLMARFGVPATIRASLSFYNTADDVEALGTGIEKAIEVFRG